MSAVRYIGDNWSVLGPQTASQIETVLITVAISTATGLPLGVLAARREAIGNALLGIASVALTIPSFALFALLSLLLTAVGDAPVIFGLVLYAQLPLLRNTRTGLRAVDPAVVEAARGMGMTPVQVLTRVELPLAAPVIIAGLRQATVMVVAIATVGAAVGSANLGQSIFDGLQKGLQGTASSSNNDEILAAVILVALIGIAADALLGGLQRLISRGRVTAPAA